VLLQGVKSKDVRTIKKTKEVSSMKGQCKQKEKKQIHQDIVDELQNIQINNDLLQSCLVSL